MMLKDPNLSVSHNNSWEIMREIKQCISRKKFQNCLGIGSSQENRYCQPPSHPDHRGNPLDWLRRLIEALIRVNHVEIAHTALNYLAGPLECRLAPINSPIPDKPTVPEECVDDYCAKTKLDEMLRNGEKIELVMQQAERCKREIDETVVLYCEERTNLGKW